MKTFISLLLLFVIIFSCSDDNRINNNEGTDSSTTLENKQIANALNTQVIIEDTPANTLELSISQDNYQILFNSSVGQGSTQSSFTFLKDGEQMFNMNFWMLLCDAIVYVDVMDSIVVKADSLVDLGINRNDLEVANDMIADAHTDVLDELQTNDGRKLELYSNIFFQKSILTTASRAIASDEACECTPHPRHLMGKTYFLCQEDYFYNVAQLQAIIADYINEHGAPDEPTSDLISFLNSTSKQEVRFDEVYNFYFPKNQYIQMLEGKAASQSGASGSSAARDDCAWYCPRGCGSDWGCCGNYSGCCLYWDPLCYVHDTMCITCKPKLFCGWGCVPDVPGGETFIITLCNWLD